MGCNPQDFMRISSKQLGALILLQYCNILHVLKRSYYTLINYANSLKMSKIKAKGSKELFYGKCKSTSKVDITFLFQNLSFEKEKTILIYYINLKTLNKFGLPFNIAIFFFNFAKYGYIGKFEHSVCIFVFDVLHIVRIKVVF